MMLGVAEQAGSAGNVRRLDTANGCCLSADRDDAMKAAYAAVELLLDFFELPGLNR
jgi:hypothetical protein